MKDKERIEELEKKVVILEKELLDQRQAIDSINKGLGRVSSTTRMWEKIG
jgi:hypothetical protein